MTKFDEELENKIKIKRLVNLGTVCPTQWRGKTFDDRPIYIRFRWGYLTAQVGKKDGDVWDAIDNKPVFSKQIDRNEYAGFLLDSRMRKILSYIFDFPKNSKIDIRKVVKDYLIKT